MPKTFGRSARRHKGDGAYGMPNLLPPELLQAELSKLDRDIDGAIRKSPAWQADADLLTSAPA
jgi:hypothetical protein